VSQQASARTDFARFICLSPRLSAPGTPRMRYCRTLNFFDWLFTVTNKNRSPQDANSTAYASQSTQVKSRYPPDKNTLEHVPVHCELTLFLLNFTATYWILLSAKSLINDTGNIGHFRVVLYLFFQSESWSMAFHMKMSFYSHDKTHLYIKSFARSLALKKWHKTIRKWPINPTAGTLYSVAVITSRSCLLTFPRLPTDASEIWVRDYTQLKSRKSVRQGPKTQRSYSLGNAEQHRIYMKPQ